MFSGGARFGFEFKLEINIGSWSSVSLFPRGGGLFQFEFEDEFKLGS